MNIGIIGLGKLGMPVALAMDTKGHAVMGYDVVDFKMQKKCYPWRELGPNGEPGMSHALAQSTIAFGSMSEVVRHSDIIFVAVQTPHQPLFEGITRLPEERADFDYTYLCNAVMDLSRMIEREGKPKTVVIISTVLPGTMRDRIEPLLCHWVRLVYNPSFIAMGTVIRDFLDPEFVLLGAREKDREALDQVEEFYRSIVPDGTPIYKTNIENAELIKVSYNTFISLKIAFANTLMEICHELPGCDVDQVTDGLKLAHKRLISPAYLSGGMGDGGGCHPRDNIAMSWLARELGLSFDIFEAAMLAREKQAEYLADLMCEYDMTKMILGPQYKPGTDIMTGSPALLVANIVRERGHDVKLVVSDGDLGNLPAVILIGAKEPSFRLYPYPRGSVIIDPWRHIPDLDGITVVGVGRG